MALAPRVFLTAEQIQKRVREMGDQISADYPEGPLYLISILKGAFIFMADLSRHIKTPRASSSWGFPATAAAKHRRAK
jgi:hypoxanthine-guanine phosphoribosyltransferase